MRVTDPTKQIGATTFNLDFWQLAGMNRVSPLVTLTIADDGSRMSGAEVWNDQDDPAKRVTITHVGTGVYQINAAATYPDENGVEQDVEFHGALISAIGTIWCLPPIFSLDSAVQVTIRTFDAAGSPTDMAFSVDLK